MAGYGTAGSPLTSNCQPILNTRSLLKKVYPYKLYAAICCIRYMLNSIIPANGFKTDLVELMKNCPLAQEKEMGFPVDWKTDPFWKLMKP